MSKATQARRFAALAVMTPLALPAVATAAGKPIINTLAASSVTAVSAQMNGSVNPNGAETFYFFQVGPTTFYGSDSATLSAGSGTRASRVSAPVEALAPATRYHYRLVASNRFGRVDGPDRTFTTARVPLSLTLAATPNPVRFGRSTVLVGNLGGTGNAGRQVQLQANPWPYTQGFGAFGNTLVTDAAGGFSVPILSIAVNTQYRAVLVATPALVSPVTTVGVSVGVTTRARPRRLQLGRRVRFSGTITPPTDGQPVEIQKLVRGVWTTIARTTARHRSATRSGYRRRIKLRHGGQFRVMADVIDGTRVSNTGRSVRIRVHH